MKAQFPTELISSFYLWFENKLLGDKSEAYAENQSNTFEYTDGFVDIPSSQVAYQGKFRQLVADSSAGQMNSGVFVDGVFTTGSSPDITIDYNDGRVILPAASGTNLTITANNTVKEVNTYITEDDEETLLTTSDFVDSADTTSTNLFSKIKKRDEKVFVLPACFIRFITNENNEFSFGGEEDTVTRVQVVVMARDNYTLDSILGLFTDTVRECIPRIPFEDFPYGGYFDIKDFPYDYSTFSSSYSAKSFVERVNTSKVNSSAILNKIDKDILVGFIDFDVSTLRYPRA